MNVKEKQLMALRTEVPLLLPSIEFRQVGDNWTFSLDSRHWVVGLTFEVDGETLCITASRLIVFEQVRICDSGYAAEHDAHRVYPMLRIARGQCWRFNPATHTSQLCGQSNGSL